MENTLPQLRTTRRKRRYRRAIGATATCLAVAAIWLAFPSDKPLVAPVVRIEPGSPPIETIAIMRIDDYGAIRLEEIASTDLGQIELVFGQAPLVPYDSQY